MAPEQITNGAITPATDIFAVGCLLYELLAYHKPFTGETVHGVLYQVLTTDPKPLRTMAPSIPASLERVVGKALNKVPEERYETARQMQSALFSIRAALSRASDTTERLSLRWTPIPSAVLRLVTHAPIKWRAAALTTLMVTALVLLYVSRSPSPVAALPDAELTGATLDQLVTYPMPAHLNAALAAQRDSALAARDRARRAGAMKNNVPSLILAETVVQNAERALRTGDLARAASGYLSAIPQYAKAQGEAEAQQREPAGADARHGGERRGGVAGLLPALHPTHRPIHARPVEHARRYGARHRADRLPVRAGRRRRAAGDAPAPGDPLHTDNQRLARCEHPRSALSARVSPRRARRQAAAQEWPRSRPGREPAPPGAASPVSPGRPPRV